MNPAPIPSELVNNVELLCLDAGNTIVFLDHVAAAESAKRAGFSLDPVALERAEGETKRRLDARPPDLLSPLLDEPGIHLGWSAFMRTAVHLAAGLDERASAECVRALWRAHREFNLWRRVPAGLVESVHAVRRAGVRVVVVSNSEGELTRLFARLGILDAFDLVIDSQLVGVEKPDPRIFQFALDHAGVPAERALHLGDTVAIDVVGARAAGIRVALVDPFDHYAGQHADVPRVPGVAAVASAVLAARSGSGEADRQ